MKFKLDLALKELARAYSTGDIEKQDYTLQYSLLIFTTFSDL